MLFPGSRIWYEGAVADIATLTEEIKSSGFSGHIVLEFQDSLDVVVCVGGEFVKVVELIGGRLLSAKKYREIWGKCRIKQGRMTVFELPPRLAQRLRGIRGRRVLCTGTAAGGCDPLRIIGELKAGGFSGILDAVSPGGKLLLDFESGVIAAAYATSFAGPALEGFDAFRDWHEGFVRADAATVFSVAGIAAPGDGQLWDEILMAGTERVALPLLPSTERLAHRYGRTVPAGEVLFAAGARPAQAYYLLTGEVELFPAATDGISVCRRLGSGALFGVSWLQDLAPARFGARATVESRLLAFGRDALPTVFANSPQLAARCVRASAALLARMRSRLEAFRAEPRLHAMETEVIATLRRPHPDNPDGLAAADLFAELAQVLPLSLPEIDALFRRLVSLGSISQTGGKIALTLREL
ncbi:MAG TPA: cyclic nucleotide-binding domain-containing protein [bacterium]